MPPVYFPGQKVEVSGYYKVVHYKHREDDSHTSFTAGVIFPHCSKCDDLNEYVLVSAIVAPPSEFYRQQDAGD